jgi:5-methylcytosine-specific restriction protein A
MRRDDWLCVPCRALGRLTPARDVDHIVSVEQGGDDSPGNLRAICGDCHDAATRAQAAAARRAQAGKQVQAVGADGWPIEGVK